MYKLPTPTALLTRTAALEIAKTYDMPVVVPNEWLRYDVAWPNGDTTHYRYLSDAEGMILYHNRSDYVTQNEINHELAIRRICPDCGIGKPISEFQNSPYYDRNSEGMETPEDNEECRACIQDANAHAEMVARKECFA